LSEVEKKMRDPMTFLIRSENADSIIGAMDAMMPEIPTEFRRQFATIKMRYWRLYGMQGLFDRVNNKTVQQVLEEFEGTSPKPIASGKIGEISYELFDAPDETK
jgi:hypothetical protein